MPSKTLSSHFNSSQNICITVLINNYIKNIYCLWGIKLQLKGEDIQ